MFWAEPHAMGPADAAVLVTAAAAKTSNTEATQTRLRKSLENKYIAHP